MTASRAERPTIQRLPGAGRCLHDPGNRREPPLLEILVDADACPVKDEVYRVARRHRLKVRLVANSWMRVPGDELIEMVVVPGDFDAADDWIAEHAGPGDVVISEDIPLAARCLKNGARVLGPRGRVFTEDMIGDALAGRELMSQLRDMGAVSGGPAPIGKRDRSTFAHKLDEIVNAVRRELGDERRSA